VAQQPRGRTHFRPDYRGVDRSKLRLLHWRLWKSISRLSATSARGNWPTNEPRRGCSCAERSAANLAEEARLLRQSALARRPSSAANILDEKVWRADRPAVPALTRMGLRMEVRWSNASCSLQKTLERIFSAHRERQPCCARETVKAIYDGCRVLKDFPAVAVSDGWRDGANLSFLPTLPSTRSKGGR